MVSTDDLIRAGWAERGPSTNALRVHLSRFRHRIKPLATREDLTPQRESAWGGPV
ncbi:MAG: hypothetical protein ACR2LJ_04620 [Acidimicrobiales bacterium]